MFNVKEVPSTGLCTLDENLQGLAFKEWGAHFIMKSQFFSALKYLDKSLKIRPDDIDTIRMKSLTNSQLGEIDEAYEDIDMAYEINPKDFKTVLQRADCIYDKNELEKYKLLMSVHSNDFMGKRREFLRNELLKIDGQYQNIIGTCAGSCLLDLRKYINKLDDGTYNKIPDTRPVWKTLNEKGQCDASSIFGKEKAKVNQLESLRIRQNFEIFTQSSLLRGWKDVIFLKDFVENEKMHIAPLKKIDILEDSKTTYANVLRWMSMMHARKPIYATRYQRFHTKNNEKKVKDIHFLRCAIQTREEFFNQLINVINLRKHGTIEKLVDYVTHLLEDYFSIKTIKVMPRKYEFLNDIINIVGLAYIDKLHVPEVHLNCKKEEIILLLFGLPFDKEKSEIGKYKFGDRRAIKSDAPDYNYINYKKAMMKLESNIRFSKYTIQKCFFYHEIAKKELSMNKFDECRMMGRKIIDEATKIGNSIWKLLGMINICKGNVAQKKPRTVKDNLLLLQEEMLPIFNLNHLNAFIQNAVVANNYNLEEYNKLDLEHKIKNTLKHSSRKSVTATRNNI